MKKNIHKQNKFTFFDVETANRSRASICQIAIIVMEFDKVIESKSYLVKPEPNFFDPINESVHGITKNEVKNEKKFKEIWPLISQYFTNDYLVIAHNAGFDISCLRSVSTEQNIEMENFSYFCSLFSLKKVDPTLEEYNLEYLSNRFALSFNHHNALDDANILISIFNEYSKTISEFVEMATKKGYKSKKFN